MNIHPATERLTIYTAVKDIGSKLPGHTFVQLRRKCIVQLD